MFMPDLLEADPAVAADRPHHSALLAHLCARESLSAGDSHHLFHAQGWLGTVCYLQDLFTAPEARGRGNARALIEAVAEAARARDAARLYWLTAEDNLPGRALYDRVARYKGFIRYDYPL